MEMKQWVVGSFVSPTSKHAFRRVPVHCLESTNYFDDVDVDVDVDEKE